MFVIKRKGCFARMILILGISLQCCAPQTESQQSLELIDQFKMLNRSTLDKYDSCVFVSYIEHMERKDEVAIDIASGVQMTSVTCPYNGFSFTLLRSATPVLFYGLFDVYNMRYSEVLSDSGRIVEVENSALSRIINNVIEENVTGEKKIPEMLQKIYSETVRDTLRPVFDGMIRLEDLADHVSKSTLEEIVKIVGHDNHAIFLGRDFGCAIFVWKKEKNSENIKEYMIPFRRYKHFQTDVAPEFELNCLIDSNTSVGE
jgi:hypothetical protein